MSKKKYKYNPQSLKYEAVHTPLWLKLLKVGLWTAPSLLLGILFSLLFTKRFQSPHEQSLKREVRHYKREMELLHADMQLANKVLDALEQRDEDLYRIALYADQFPKELRSMGFGGSDKYLHLEGYSNSSLLVQTAKEMDLLEGRLHAQSLSYQELIKLANNKEKMLTSIPAIQPVSNKELTHMTSGFGYRIDPIYKTRRMHTGMDFIAAVGTDVYATGDGVVEALENSNWGYGKCVVINHGFGYKTRYAHLSAFKVRAGQRIRRGMLIGLVGNTGKSTGAHLHYEVEKGGVKVNPVHYYHSDLSPEQYAKLIEMSKNSFKALD